jgi:calcium-translocating P-type ATPase
VTHFFAILLWFASGLAWLAGMPQLAAAIIVVVVVNGLFAFAQEYRAERAAERLTHLLPRTATVIRDGRRSTIAAEDLVPGDLVWLSTGDHVSADLLPVELHELAIDASTLTGESVPEYVAANTRIHAGTWVTGGEALAVVTATGVSTRLAGIARVVQTSERPPSPLAIELNRIVRTIAAIAIGVGGAFFGTALLVGTPPSDGFLFAVGVTVALVPEGLLPTVTLALAMGAQRMTRRNALVRRLESVETLGSTTFICTDKTGTLTRNEMEVVAVWTPGGSATIHGNGYEPAAQVEADDSVRPALLRLALAAARCSDGRAVEQNGEWTVIGDPMEAAIVVFARRLGIDVDKRARSSPVRARFPFDAARRRMSVVVGEEVIVKGAPDAILPRSWPEPGANGACEELARQGLRCIAVASREIVPGETPVSDADAEHDLTLLGILALQDPPRDHAAAAIAACRRAGIRVAMLTGDHPATADAIGRQVGLTRDESIVLEGADLPADESMLGAILDRDGVIVSRVTPEDKLRIARALQARGHVVAMTGDGVNDGPALRQADIGIAMGKSGSDVAREAADLVLLDDDFATIVEAIREGRATFANIRRFLTYHLTDNVAELTPFVVWSLSGGKFPLALAVLQILVLDIVTDALPALALGSERPSATVLDRPPNRGQLLDGQVMRRVFGVLGPTEALIEMSAFLATFIALGWRPGDSFATGETLLAASGAAFAAVVVGQMATAFACRSVTDWPGRLGWTSNRLLVFAVAFQAVALLGLLYIPALAELLDQAPPTAAGWGVALAAAPSVLAIDAAHKRWRASRFGGSRG